MMAFAWFVFFVLLVIIGPHFRETFAALGAPVRGAPFVLRASSDLRWKVLLGAGLAEIAAAGAVWWARYRGFWLLGCGMAAVGAVFLFGLTQAPSLLGIVWRFTSSLHPVATPR